MNTLTEIESAVEALPWTEQEELFRHLARRLQEPAHQQRRLPLVPATGRRITQADIDDTLDAD